LWRPAVDCWMSNILQFCHNECFRQSRWLDLSWFFLNSKIIWMNYKRDLKIQFQLNPTLRQ
jgi:hypothetical protein